MKQPTKQRTTIYLPEGLRWELRRVMAERHVDSDTKAVEEAVRVWIKSKPGAPQLVVANKDPWLVALARILASGHHNAISAVQQNITTFYEMVGFDPNDLPLASAPERGFDQPQTTNKTASK